MAIFQKSVINNHLLQLDKNKIDEAFKKFKENYSQTKISEIKKLKEEEYQDGFLRDIFVDLFAYTLKPADNYDLAREFKNKTDGKKADGAILKNDNAIAIIELKSTKTKDLTSITQQAFNYKNNQPECKYVITSNFQKLRFYIDYANEYEEFDLFNLQKEDFSLLYLLLHKDSIFTDLPLKLKTETKFHEENISDKLYKDYSAFKRKIYENLVKNNPQYDKLTLFKKSQKFLDRLLFVFFAEDTGLVPPNAISKIVEQWQLFIDNDEYFSLYSRFVKFFGHLDKGHKYKTYNLPAYNGGLFAPDEILDNITIDDEILKDDTLYLSSYDYSTEVDVNILGHIFEHSLNEIEEITAEIKGTAQDKSKSKRKKDGVFYTPKYITQYIVENTIGKLCIEKRQELGISEIEFDNSFKTQSGKYSAKGKKLFDTLQAYKDWLFNLKIIDPACGSGAFLNQALNFLIEEHKQIDDIIAELTGETMRLFDTDKAILENNLYGVDINEESVEIAKLSLWLRTAQKDRKLSNLNSNIKCGNSLIDDLEVAGDKAFDWNVEFKEIMDNGGFDVVVGNPPYVPTEYIPANDKVFLEKRYKSAFGRINLYPVFYEKGIEVLNNRGLLGYITPYTILKNQYYIEARKYILKKTSLINIIDFKGITVFEDAAVDSIIILLKKEQNINNTYSQIFDIKDFINNDFKILEIKQDEILNTEDFSLFKSPNEDLIGRISKNTIPLKQIVNFNQGIITGSNKKFITEVQNEQTKKVITGSDFNRYSLSNSNQYIVYDIERLHRPRKKEIFEVDKKILLRQTGAYPICSIDLEKHYTLDTVHNGIIINEEFNIKFLISLLNSKLIRFLYENQINETGKVFAQVKIIYVNPLPIKEISLEAQQPFIEKANLMLSLNKELQKEKDNFLNTLKEEKGIEKITKKLDAFYDFEYDILKKELTKQKVKFALGNENNEWREYFNTSKQKINNIQNQINQTDKEIDKMVYELYELTAEEIEIVEGSVK